nr:ATP-binding protein [Nitrospiraceae bacterium]
VTQQEDHLLLVIEDNGQGFNVEQARTHARRGNSIGLLGMEERAKLVGGELTITSSPKTGTRLTASLPLVGLNPHLTTSEASLA